MNRNIRINFLEHPLVSENKTLNRKYLIIYYLIFVLTILLFSQFDAIFLRERYFSYQEGDRVEETVYSSKTLSFINDEASEKKQRLALDLILPVYVIKEDISERILDHFALFRQNLTAAAGSGSLDQRLVELEEDYPGIQYLKQIDEIDSVRLNLMMTTVQDSLESLLTRGILRRLDTSGTGATGLIEIVRSELGEKVTVPGEKAATMDNWQSSVREYLSHYDFSEGEEKFIEVLVYYFLEPNCFFSSELTELKKQEVLKTLTPVWEKMEPGSVLLTRGTVITGRELQRIEALKNSRGRVHLNTLISPFLYTALVFLLLAVLLIAFPSTIGLLEAPHLVFFLSWFHIAVSLLLFRFLSGSGSVSAALFLPSGLISIILALLTGRRETMIFITVQAVFIFLVLNFHAGAFYLTLFSGFGACLVIEGAEKRIDLIKGGLFLAFVEIVLTVVMVLIEPVSLKILLLSCLVAGLNGLISGFLSLMVLPLFEHILNACTTFRLQELSDLNAPVLKRMLALAPGTYAHSINVANLAETGCRNIGADALLARVGAYYHDIGKIDQSKYFSENQKDYNKHDDLKTTMSVAVIKSHVKIGTEKARELNLPEKVINIISQHHGTSVIEYFYQRAVNEKGADNISLEDYSHTGPKPQTKEAAVVMMADMAEAATRSMSKPTVNKLEKFLWDLIMIRFKEGELNECGMTLQELEVVKSSFVHVLTGQYHTRIEYPDRERNQDE